MLYRPSKLIKLVGWLTVRRIERIGRLTVRRIERVGRLTRVVWLEGVAGVTLVLRQKLKNIFFIHID